MSRRSRQAAPRHPFRRHPVPPGPPLTSSLLYTSRAAHILIGIMSSLLLRAGPLFAALADPMRLAILDRLRSGERSVNELCGDTAAGQSLMSFHLKTLRDAGLVFPRKEGRTVWYALDPSGVARLERLVSVLQGQEDQASEASKRMDLEVCLEYINDG